MVKNGHIEEVKELIVPALEYYEIHDLKSAVELAHCIGDFERAEAYKTIGGILGLIKTTSKNS